jgi:integrase
MSTAKSPYRSASADRHRSGSGITSGDDRLYPLWRLASHTGMRRSELLGLRWSDVDLEAATVSVARARARVRDGMHEAASTTTGKSRVVDLDEVTSPCCAGGGQLRRPRRSVGSGLRAVRSGVHPRRRNRCPHRPRPTAVPTARPGRGCADHPIPRSAPHSRIAAGRGDTGARRLQTHRPRLGGDDSQRLRPRRPRAGSEGGNHVRQPGGRRRVIVAR